MKDDYATDAVVVVLRYHVNVFSSGSCGRILLSLNVSNLAELPRSRRSVEQEEYSDEDTPSVDAYGVWRQVLDVDGSGRSQRYFFPVSTWLSRGCATAGGTVQVKFSEARSVRGHGGVQPTYSRQGN